MGTVFVVVVVVDDGEIFASHMAGQNSIQTSHGTSPQWQNSVF